MFVVAKLLEIEEGQHEEFLVKLAMFEFNDKDKIVIEGLIFLPL